MLFIYLFVNVRLTLSQKSLLVALTSCSFAELASVRKGFTTQNTIFGSDSRLYVHEKTQRISAIAGTINHFLALSVLISLK